MRSDEARVKTDAERVPQLNPATYEWSARLFTTVRKLLKVNIKLHHSEGQIQSGDIFVFNHFARLETFIPQYLIYRETGAFCRSIASHEFFAEDDAFSNYLLGLGAIPNNYPRLLPLLAEEILRGRKVVVFPEGGMVKDRRVLDRHGRFSIYSPAARERRKHHTGAAVIALTLDAFKWVIRCAAERGESARLEQWRERLGLASVDELLATARRPTRIVPANITFYPIRVDDNLLRQGAKLVARGLSRRLTEELMIEGNILLKDTDMDIRLGEPVDAADYWRRWELPLFRGVIRNIDSPDHLLAYSPTAERWPERMAARWLRNKALRIRNDYMLRVYAGVTVNLSHLASRLIVMSIDAGRMEIGHARFCRTLYLALKALQRSEQVHLHRSLRNPVCYRGVAEGRAPGVRQLLKVAEEMELLSREAAQIRFLPKLLVEHEFHEIRLENLVAVYANEAEPVLQVTRALQRAVREEPALDARGYALHRFDDERREHAWDRAYFDKPRFGAINRQETATESGEPFLLRPKSPRGLGVLLVHGFLASPAELAEFGKRLVKRGFTVLGVRLKGHGTSPWDLRERSWQDWFDSVRSGYEILAELTPRVGMVGFSTGGALALLLAAEKPAGLAGVAVASVPLRFRNRNLIFVPLLHRANRVASWLPSLEGIVPFRPNESEHPHINYRNIPVRGLYELRLLVERLEQVLPQVSCPVSVLQGTEDHVVDPRSAQLLLDGLGSTQKESHEILASRHGILNENIGASQEIVATFLERLDKAGDPRSGSAEQLSAA